MATFVKLNGFVEHLAEKTHNLGADVLTLALSDTAPAAETPDPSVLTADCILANVTQVAYTNLSTRVITTTSSAQTGGIYKLTLTDLVLTAGAGPVAGFRYVYIYNETATVPVDALIGYYDYGSTLVLAAGETLTVDFDDANGVLQLV
tara:strand:- start:27209 stop:27652 length:444 start_codon:yes stop_codon:yes gene_type:complete